MAATLSSPQFINDGELGFLNDDAVEQFSSRDAFFSDLEGAESAQRRSGGGRRERYRNRGDYYNYKRGRYNY